MQVAYERVQVVEGIAAVFPLTDDDVGWRTGVGGLAGRAGTGMGGLGGVKKVCECGRSAVLR
jgi:hypothetical protein